MTYTEEELNSKSDAEINTILKNKLFGDGWHTEVCIRGINYCEDWRFIGPLILEYKIDIRHLLDGSVLACSQEMGVSDDSVDWKEVVHMNPLRAATQCLVLVLQEVLCSSGN